MAYYLVRARLHNDLRAALRAFLDSGEIRQMRPFGQALQHSLDHARMDPQGWVTWEEEDYCTPPLAQERAAVLDTYFTDLHVERVAQGEGWGRIESLPTLWYPLILYGATYCEDTEHTRGRLRELGIAFQEINIDHDRKAEHFVFFINGGNRSTPTLVFGAERHKIVLTEPTDEELDRVLEQTGYSLKSPPA